jgi:iron(III) transport system substrate-binding protein
MKKILAFFLIAMVAFAAFANGETELKPAAKTEVELAIEKAQTMTLAELEAAAKAELEANPDLTFNADSLTSGIKKALAAFEKKYEWAAGRTAYNSKKGSEYQPKLIAAQKANSYIADFVMIQDASFLKNAMLDTHFLLSYDPSDAEIKIADGDKNPLVGVTFNKVFIYDNRTVGPDQLKNVWQMTGVDGVSLKGVHNVSYQNPLGEDINMSFLIMLTSPSSCERLAKAYKSYFGKDYVDEPEYMNIGYKFVKEFIGNVGYWHSSDSSEIKGLMNYADDGRIIFAGLCKLKDYEYYKKDYKDSDLYYTKTVTAGGWNNEIEGFDGFVYNMWTLIPATAKLPYTACLFIKYIHSAEGYNAGWGGILGYYSSNTNIPSVDGDPALSEWKQKCVVEDVQYIDKSYATVVKFINMALAGK